jgi:hypothetical protein
LLCGRPQKGEAVSTITLVLSNVSIPWTISPQSADGKTGTPGVEFSTAKFALNGDVVATADLSKKDSWQVVKPEDVSTPLAVLMSLKCCSPSPAYLLLRVLHAPCMHFRLWLSNPWSASSILLIA